MSERNVQKSKGRIQQTFWFSKEEKQALDNCMEDLEISRSEIVRLALEQFYESIDNETLQVNPERKFTRPTDKLGSLKIKQKHQEPVAA